MENQPHPKVRVKHPDRVALSAVALSRIANWLEAVETRLKGSRLTKNDLVNFLILSHSTSLSERELEQLERDHFDEVRFAAWALKELKAARENGKTVTFAEIINGAPIAKQNGGADGNVAAKPTK